MTKRNWPSHPGIGRQIKVDGIPVTVVDVKAGPMLGNVSEALEGKDLVMTGTLCLRVQWSCGAEDWLPPTDGDAFVAWCQKQDSVKELTT